MCSNAFAKARRQSVSHSLIIVICVTLLNFNFPAANCLELYPFNETFGDNTTEVKDDGGSGNISLPIDFPFYNRTYRFLFVNNNGLISFHKQFEDTDGYKPRRFDKGPNRTIAIVAPYWSDVDIEHVKEVPGFKEAVYYRKSEDRNLLNRASNEIRENFVNHKTFNATLLLIATWYEVGFYGAEREGKSKRNTFQAVLVTDGKTSFSIFNYAKLTWTTGSNSAGETGTGLGGEAAVVGFNSGVGQYYVFPSSGNASIINLQHTTNTGLAGRWIYQISGGDIGDLSCKKIVRRCPFLKSRSHQSHEGDDLSVGSTVTFSCDEGYELRGARTLICRTDGDWNTAQPTCQIVRCPELFASSNVRMSRHTSSGNIGDFGMVGSVAEFSCSPGYNGSGSSRRVCQADGEWSGQTFTCTEVDCGFPGNIGNGSIGHLQGTTVGSTAILMCHEGAVASSESIICREDGQWSQGRCIACRNDSNLHSFLYNHKCYVFVDDPSWFSDAKGYCSAKGWDLVSILNRELNNFLTERKTHLNWSDDVWIGAEWRNGQWEWPHETMMWSNWDSGEGGTIVGWKLEKCAVLASNGKWKDKVWWPGSRKFICEANISQ